MLLAAVGGRGGGRRRCIERGLLRFFYGRDEVLLVLVTYALFLILEDATKLVWGANPYFVSEPYGLFGNVRARRADLRRLRLRCSSRWQRSCGIAVWWGLNRTRSGKIVLAVIHSAEIAREHGRQRVARLHRSRSRSASSWPRSAAPSPRR